MKKQIAIMVDEEVKKKLDLLCKQEHRSQANMISVLIRNAELKEE